MAGIPGAPACTAVFWHPNQKDIRKSNDVLTDIVKTDDSIYKELKILLDFALPSSSKYKIDPNRPKNIISVI